MKFENAYLSGFHIIRGMWLFIHAGIKIIDVSNKGPWEDRSLVTAWEPAYPKDVDIGN